MKKLILASSLLLLVSGCYPKPLETNESRGYEISLIFENNGCKVYRFHDMGHFAYYSDCTGKVLDSINSKKEIHDSNKK